MAIHYTNDVAAGYLPPQPLIGQFTKTIRRVEYTDGSVEELSAFDGTRPGTAIMRREQFEACDSPVRLDRIAGAGRDYHLAVEITHASGPAFIVGCGTDGGRQSISVWAFAPEAYRGDDHWAKLTKLGFVTQTDGELTDYRAIERHIIGLSEVLKVRSVAVDRHYASGTLWDHVVEASIHVAAVHMGWRYMAPALQRFIRAIEARKISHGGDPVLWHSVQNAVVAYDAAGNGTLHKGKSKGIIGALSAAVMAHAQADKPWH